MKFADIVAEFKNVKKPFEIFVGHFYFNRLDDSHDKSLAQPAHKKTLVRTGLASLRRAFLYYKLSNTG